MNKTITTFNKAINLDVDKLLERLGINEKGYELPTNSFFDVLVDECINEDNGELYIMKYIGNHIVFVDDSEVDICIPLSDFLIATIDDVVREIYDIRDEIDLGKYKTFLPNSFGVYQFDDNDDDKKMVKEEIKDKLMDVLETQNLDSIQQYMQDIINLLKKDEKTNM